MSAIDAHQPGTPDIAPDGGKKKPFWETYVHQHHWRNADDEFDAAKFGMWLFLSTEVLLFAGIFVGYAILRHDAPPGVRQRVALPRREVGPLNTVVLLLSWTVAMAVRCAQLNQQKWLKHQPDHHADLRDPRSSSSSFLRVHPEVERGQAPRRPVRLRLRRATPTSPCGGASTTPRTASTPCTSSSARACSPGSSSARTRASTAPRTTRWSRPSGLYWHLVDLVWIFLFPLLYLIH
jgi:cytochrome c oxidase subunit 3